MTPPRRAAGALVALVVAVVLVRWWGLELVESGSVLKLRAMPFFGQWATRDTEALVGAVIAAMVVVALGPVFFRRVPWFLVAVGGAVLAAVWAVALFAPDGGLADIGVPLEGRSEYLRVVPTVDDLGVSQFLSTYTDRLADYPVHVEGHPPGMIVVLWALTKVGLSKSFGLGVAMVAMGASAVTAALITTREVVGEAEARRAAPALALAPAAIWVATTADAFFLGVSTWAITALIFASRRRGTTAAVLAVAGGALGALGLHLSYGLGAVLVVAAVVVVVARAWRVVAWAIVGAVPVLIAFVAGGFWWFDGLAATRERYDFGVASTRPYGFFVVANLVVFAVIIGPAAVAGLATLTRRMARLAVPGVVAVLAADVSGLSKGEVERIWLPFVPWVAIAAGGSRLGPRWDRWLLAGQAAVGLVLAALLDSPW